MAMDALEALTSRRSAIRLTEPAPPDDVLTDILTAAARAPDHGRLRPWRFILIRGESRHRLGEVLAAALLARDPDAPAPLVDKQRLAPLRAPLIVVVAATVDPDHPKIPPVEQVLSAGCAAHNIMLSANAAGFGCMWKTGAPAYDPAVKSALGLAPDHQIVGFMYLGTEPEPAPAVRRPDVADFMSVWEGSADSLAAPPVR